MLSMIQFIDVHHVLWHERNHQSVSPCWSNSGAEMSSMNPSWNRTGIPLEIATVPGKQSKEEDGLAFTILQNIANLHINHHVCYCKPYLHFCGCNIYRHTASYNLRSSRIQRQPKKSRRAEEQIKNMKEKQKESKRYKKSVFLLSFCW